MGYHRDDLVSAATNIPPVSQQEAMNWRLRNACEVAVLVKLGFVDARVLDDIAREDDHAQGARQLANELASWREFCGLDALPVQRQDFEAPVYHLPSYFSECAQMLSDLSQSLLCEDEKLSVSAPISIAESGPESIKKAAAWRPSYSGTSKWKAIELEGVPSQMLRRSWFTTPDEGPIIVTSSGAMTSKQLDVWWGIHNGAHLDLLSALGQRALREVEMGSGLLLSEAIAMSLEILAALETRAGRANFCLHVLGKGFIERANRLRRRDHQSYLAGDAGNAISGYWAALPRIAEAYVVGPIRLIGSGFNTADASGLDLEPIAQRFRELSLFDDFTQAFMSRAEVISRLKVIPNGAHSLSAP